MQALSTSVAAKAALFLSLAALLLVVAPPADAATLSTSRAKAASKRFLADYYKSFGKSFGPHIETVKTCKRKNQRTVDCGFERSQKNKVTGITRKFCDGIVRVRLKRSGAASARMLKLPSNPACFKK